MEHVSVCDINQQIDQLLTELLSRRFGHALSKSMRSVANLISLNEAIHLFSSVQYHTSEDNPDRKEKIREGYARSIALGHAPDETTISPFNPPDNFYVWTVNSGRGPLIVEALGRNISEVLWNLIRYIIERVYGATIRPAKYKSFIIDKQGKKIGELYFTKEKGAQNKTCLIGRVRREKRIEKILARYEVRGFIIKIVINCPEHVKRTILPFLRKLEDKLINLLQKPQKTDRSSDIVQ